MENENIINILEQRGYDTYSAKLVVSDLTHLANPLNLLFEEWLSDEEKIKDYVANGFSIAGLMEERNMTYPAALLTIDWIIKEPTEAIKSLKRGIK